jgi:hypothetical protein
MKISLLPVACLACLLSNCAVEGVGLDTANDSNLPHIGPSVSPDGSTIDTSKTDLIADSRSPDLLTNTLDLAGDTSSDLTSDLPPPNLIVDTSPDLKPDLKPDLSTPDLSLNLPIGTSCIHNNDCRSSFCTDNVCCDVAKCVDTCTPGSSTCTPYNGFTCAPYGTCRGY